MTPEFSVLEYLGKIGDGVLVLLSAVYDSEYYEATYFYKDDGDVLTLSDDLDAAISNSESERPTMDFMVASVRSKVVPYGQIFGRIDDVDFNRWLVSDDEKAEESDLEAEPEE